MSTGIGWHFVSHCLAITSISENVLHHLVIGIGQLISIYSFAGTLTLCKGPMQTPPQPAAKRMRLGDVQVETQGTTLCFGNSHLQHYCITPS